MLIDEHVAPSICVILFCAGDRVLWGALVAPNALLSSTRDPIRREREDVSVSMFAVSTEEVRGKIAFVR